MNDNNCVPIFFLYFNSQLSQKASLTVSPDVKAKTDTVTAKSPSGSPRIATARILLTGETETKTRTEKKRKEAAVQMLFLTGATAKTAHVAAQTQRSSAGIAGIAGITAAATLSPYH